MEDLLEQISNYLVKSEEALDAGEIEKAKVYTEMAQIVVSLTNVRGPAMHVLRSRGVGRPPGVRPSGPEDPSDGPPAPPGPPTPPERPVHPEPATG